MGENSLYEKVSRANIVYHTILAETYDETQPYFSLENVERIRELVLKLMDNKIPSIFLDIACGTGFMLSIVNSYFDYCIGLDITPEMVVEARRKFYNMNVFLCIGDANNIPFRKSQFNFSSIYCSLHHFVELEPVLAEMYRVLKDDGVFYSDEDPNFYFLRDVKDLETELVGLSFLARDVKSVRGADEIVGDKHGIDAEVTRLSEFQRLAKNGMKKEDVENILEKVGFKRVSSEYRWFLGQGHYLHCVSTEVSNVIEGFLRGCLPLSRNLFKTFYTTAVKESK